MFVIILGLLVSSRKILQIGNSMKFTTYNIQFGRGLDGKYDLDRIAREVNNSDVIALQEVERFMQRSGDIDQVAELASLLQGYHWVYGGGVDMDGDIVQPDGTVVHRRRQFGNMLLSRTPIITSRQHFLPKYASTGPLSIQRSALEGLINCQGTLVRVYSIHLTHLSAMTRLSQIDRLLEIDSNAVREGGPISGDPANTVFAGQTEIISLPRESILLGDFNFTPDSEEYERMTGPVSDYGGRIKNPDGFVDSWTSIGFREMHGETAERNGESVRMDYCFVKQSLEHRIRSVKVHVDAVGSDHKPLSVKLDFDS